jgi:hypothetical protein
MRYTIILLLVSYTLWGQTDTTSALEAMLTQSKNKQVKLKDSLDNRIKHPVYGINIAIVVEKDFVNLSQFNAWTKTNYNTIMNPNIFSYGCNLNLISKKYEFGIFITEGFPYWFTSIYVGRSIFRKPHFRSFIDFHIGTFSFGDFGNIKPPNYTLQSSQVGKDLKLDYNSWAFSLALKGIFIPIHKTNAYFLNSFEVKFSYIPYQISGWEYGYQQDPYNYKSVKVTGIPKLPSYCVSLVYNIGLLYGRQSPD